MAGGVLCRRHPEGGEQRGRAKKKMVRNASRRPREALVPPTGPAPALRPVGATPPMARTSVPSPPGNRASFSPPPPSAPIHTRRTSPHSTSRALPHPPLRHFFLCFSSSSTCSSPPPGPISNSPFQLRHPLTSPPPHPTRRPPPHIAFSGERAEIHPVVHPLRVARRLHSVKDAPRHENRVFWRVPACRG